MSKAWIVSSLVLVFSSWLIPVLAQSPQSGAVYLMPGEDIQARVQQSPEGTDFILQAGLYRGASVTPKSGDSFTGQGKVILNGASILYFHPYPAQVGLWVANAKASTLFHGGCEKESPLCGFTQDLFIDDTLQQPVAELEKLQPGAWYFDRSQNLVYLSHDPSGHVVELGMQSAAFAGNAEGVTIRNVIVEKYATPAQQGAIGGGANGSRWLVSNSEARWNHGRGVSLGSESRLVDSFIHHNGQLGISLYGNNAQAVHNEISWNNYAGFGRGWEAGGSKFSNTTNLLVQGNNVHDNNGPGLWTDINNVDTVYDGNTVTHNRNEGIKHEISYAAVIRNNVVMNNGDVSTVWLWNAQIEIQNSSQVEVYANTVIVPAQGANGIAIINQRRGLGKFGPWVANDNYVHDNVIEYLGSGGASGLVDDTGSHAAAGNRFDFNTYISANPQATRWIWFDGKAWAALRALNQETHGVVTEK